MPHTCCADEVSWQRKLIGESSECCASKMAFGLAMSIFEHFTNTLHGQVPEHLSAWSMLSDLDDHVKWRITSSDIDSNSNNGARNPPCLVPYSLDDVHRA